MALGGSKQHTGGLAQFGVRMGELRDRKSISASIPSSWTRDILDNPSDDDDLTVLIQASLLLTNFVRADQVGSESGTIRSRYEDQIAVVTQRLIMIAVSPPTSHNIEAQILLGNLAQYAFETVVDQLEHSIESSPLGFRVWRALTKVLKIGQDLDRRNKDHVSRNLRPKLHSLLNEAARLRKESIYPGRSLDLELAIEIPTGWLGPNFVTSILLRRANDPEATLRERGTAAMGIWQRAHASGRTADPEVTGALHRLIEQFRDPESQRRDVASGLRWVAATLNRAMNLDSAICEEWPEVDEPWFHAVGDAIERLEDSGMPKSIRPATKNLFRHVLLQNAGVERRRTIDTLIAGGWVEPVTRALRGLLRDERVEEWVRIRALFALGFMQHRSQSVKMTLLDACENAYQRLIEPGDPPRARITELHTGLFAIGDCYGAKGAEKEARDVRDKLDPMLSDLVTKDLTTSRERWPLARAIVYLLTFTAQPRQDRGEVDLSESLLQRLRRHQDTVTQNFARWALESRFGPDGEIRPLLRATL